MFDINYFKTQQPMKYYDCGGNFNNPKAQAMINNEKHNYIATLKNDGEWCRIIINNSDNIIAQSRNISKVTGEYGDKTALIPHIIEEFKQFPEGTVFLGELCFNDIHSTAKDVGTILRCLPQKAIARQANNKLYFKTFDCLSYANIDLMSASYEKRFSIMCNAIEKVNNLNYISYCNYTELNFDDYLANILNQGGEGIVIHSKNYLYSPGKRPAWTTLKVKKTTGDIEVPVVNFIEPNKIYEGTEAATWNYKIDNELVTKPYYYGWKNGIIINYNGNLVRVTSGLTDADREWLATDEAAKMLINNELFAVVSGMEITQDSIRHPRLIRIRTDI